MFLSPEKAVFWYTQVTGGQRQDNREMQKTSYSTRTRGTIPTTPTVNALVIHRRLQLKDRVRTGLADLVCGFSLEHYKSTRCSAKDVGEMSSMCKDRDISCVQPQATCK